MSNYAARTGMDARASIILAQAVITKPATVEDEDGNVMRVWQKSELQNYTNEHLNTCLRNRVAVEANEMLGTVPPSAIKYCVTKGWLSPNAGKTLFYVTRKGAIDLDLPLTFKGGANHGRKIKFVK